MGKGFFDHPNKANVRAKSSTMLFKNIFIYDELFNPSPLVPSFIGYVITQSLYKIGVFFGCIYFSLLKKEAFFECFCCWIIGAMLLSPGLSSYASILLCFPFIAILKEERLLTFSHKFLLISLIVVYVNIPISYFYDLPLWIRFPKVYLLLLIFIGYYHVFLQSIPKERTQQWLVLGGLALTFALLGWSKNPFPINNYAIPSQKHILISDFFIKDKTLQYQYWKMPQPSIHDTAIAVASFDTTSVSIIDHQVYHKNRQMTFDEGNKRKPMLINEKTIIYMSDQNRGNGFYTLLKVELE